MERVTDHQFALIDGKVRHLPGGVDEYLKLAEEADRRSGEKHGVTRKRHRSCPGSGSANRPGSSSVGGDLGRPARGVQ